MRRLSKTPELDGQQLEECALQLALGEPHWPLTMVLANTVNDAPRAAANSAISWLVPGSCCPNSLQGKARIASPCGANSACSATRCS